MADAGADQAEVTNENPHYRFVLEDIQNLSDWLAKDAEITKRRLCERKKKRTKPYPGAPNSVVPIVDDVTREKTDQETSMIGNAKLYAHIVPLKAEMPQELRHQAEVAFDTYVRFVLNAAPKIEEANDMKNARGFSVLKVLKGTHARFGTIADFETRDIRDVIVPTDTRDIRDAERITDIFRYNPRKLEALARRKRAWNRQAVKDLVAAAKDDRSMADSKTDLEDTFGVTASLVGVTTSGKGSKTVVVWEHYTYADEWIVGKDLTGRVKLGTRCKILFGPDRPDALIAVSPWNEDGRDRPWPFMQPRYENRSRFFYDSRGVGQLCMDDQIIATGEQNAKMTMLDYAKMPLFTGTGTRNSTNVSHDPGSYVPGDVKAVQMPQVPPQFDFDIEMHRRQAARRAGAGSQYEFSGQAGQRKRVQKTATEITEESMRGAMVSNASVNRFNGPWAELFQQLWEELRRMKKPLPMIEQFEFTGMAPLEIYDWPVLLVPAGNAQTIDPDRQFQRDIVAFNFAKDSLIPLGVQVDADVAGREIMSHWDPFRASQWIRSPQEAGPGGLPPVYQVLQQLSQAAQENGEMLKQVGDVVERTAALSEENAQRIDQLTQGVPA